MENKIDIRKVEEFHSYEEFNKFQYYIDWLLAEDILSPIKKGVLPTIFPSFGDEEKWYKDLNSDVWVLMPPDYPFKGFFNKLSKIE